MAIILISVICAPALYKLYSRFAYRLRRRNTSSWSLTSTKTLSATLAKIGRGGPWEVTLLYSYFAKEYESGEQRETFFDEADARSFVAALDNRKCTVRYDPNDPSTSEIVL
jgi:hypothetical protein